MKTVLITTPQRKNVSLESFLTDETTYLVNFVDENNEMHLHLEFGIEDGDFILLRGGSKYEPIKKIIHKKIELSKKHSKEVFSKHFYNIQKRLKENVRAYLREKQIKEEPIKESLIKETMKEVKETPKTTDAKVVKIERPKAIGLEGQLQDIVFNVLESDFTTQTLQNKMVELGLEPNRTEVVVKRVDGTKRNIGTQHYKFKSILQCVSAKVNIALVGPAGSGKTTAVRNVAKALDLPFYSKSVSAQTGTHEFFGYQDANGKYVRTLFREAYENGGVFLLDEFDAGNPNVLASMNQATANGECAFADGMISKHKDFVVVMAGNTFGHGATSEYVGRNKIDSATLDRFAFIHFGYDENLEMSLAVNKDWCKEVQELRSKASAKKIKTIISPRATFEGEKLLLAGMPKNEVLEVIIFKGLTEGERKLLS